MWQYVLLLTFSVAPINRAIVEEYYTTNAVCKQKYCVNPVFPGLDQLDVQEKERWVKHSLADSHHALTFCKNYVNYDFALPVLDYSKAWNFSTHTTPDVIVGQEQKASQLYFFHLSAMGLDAWDYPNPEEETDMPMSGCVAQVARMACFTYLPQANPNVKVGMDTRYLKPCKSSCQNYVKECQVECCDDSVQCVFDRDPFKAASTLQAKALQATQLQVTSGYADYEGPCAQCTGGANLMHSFAGWAGVAFFVFAYGTL